MTPQGEQRSATVTEVAKVGSGCPSFPETRAYTSLWTLVR